MAAPNITEVLATLADVERRFGCRRTASRNPLVSVIVPTLNAAAALPATLDSLARQSWPAVEVIVADAGSRDGTTRLLAARKRDISLWISAPDEGIADGFNRGIALASGEIVQITNAGDRLGPDHLARVAALFETFPQAGFVYGDVRMIDAAGYSTRTIRGRPDLRRRGFDSAAVAPHPAMAVRRVVYESVGLYDSAWPLTMDFDWLARALAAGIEGIHDPQLIAEMAEGGASNTGAMRRDVDNFRLTLRHRTMNPALAAIRLGLKSAMNLVRGGLEARGLTEYAYALRRGVDKALGRR